MFFILIRSGSISILIVTLFLLPGFSQISQPSTFELPLENGSEYPRITSLREVGILISRKVRDKSSDFLELIKVDTALQENWRGVIPIDRNLAVSKVFYRDQRVYLLLNAVGYGGYDFHVIVVNVQNQNFNRYVVKNLIPLRTTEFHVTPISLLIGGYFNNDIPVVLHFNFGTGRSRLLPGFFNDEGELSEIKTNEKGMIDIIVSTRSIERKKVLWIRSYTAEGDLIESKILKDDQKNLLSGQSIRKPDGTQVIVGNYSLHNYDYNKGIFYCELNASGEYKLQYYSFSDLENFFKYMKPVRESRIKERIQRRKAKGKKVRFTYRFMPHEFIKSNHEYLFLGEIFYPRYYYLNYGYGTRGNRIFDGYRYTHAIVLGFNEKGDLIWDNSLEINDIKTFYLLQYVRMVPLKDKLGLIYLNDHEILSKFILDNDVLQEKSSLDLNLKYNTQLVKEKRTESSYLDYWYKSNLFAYGIQYVNGRNVSDDSGRRVLFINKLKIQ